MEKDLITSKGGNYEVIRKLGEGYTGEVYLVNDESRGEPVALKLLNPEAFKEGQLAAFKREFMLLSDLHNPHVCRVFDFGYSDNKERYFFTQELVQGTDLYTFVEKMSVEEIEEIFVQIADGLGVIHQAGLIHYDIKGANILITTVPTGSLAKIVDFGLAAPSTEKPENIAGTVRYLSPEMISKNSTIDYRSDLYSLGIVLYRLLAGRYPEQGSNLKEVLAWHTSHTEIGVAPLKERGVPEYMIEVVENLTKAIPTERFSSASVIVKFIELHSGKKHTKAQKKLVSTLMEEGPLVARDEIMQKIRPALHCLSEKKPLDEKDHQTMVLSGPAGSGKTRILKEAKYIAQLTEINTYVIRGEELGQDLELFKKAIGCENQSDEDATKKLLDAGPTCLMVDNLDRCSTQVKDFVTAFANTLYSSKFMGKPHLVYLIITMTVDREDVPLPISLHLDVESYYLSPFTEEDITYYLRLAVGESNPSPAQVRDIMKFSGGVPELVKVAIATLDSPTARLSGNVDNLFATKIGSLDESARKIMGILALAEKPLNQQQLIVLSGVIVETATASLIKEGFISCDRERQTFETSTGAISTAVQSVLSDDEKKEIAGKLLAWFEEHEPGDIDVIAKYAELGAEPSKVADYLMRAGEGKESRSDLDAAYRYYNRAIQCLSGSDERLPAIHRKLARQQILNGQLDEAAGHIEAASGITGEIKDDYLFRSWIERIRHRGDEALECIEKAIEMSEKDEGGAEYLKLLNEKGQCYVLMGKADEAIDIFRKTLEAAEKLSPEEKKKVANNNLGIVLAQKGMFEDAIKFYRKKYEIFSEEKRLAASILSQLGYVYQQAGKLTESLETFKESWETYSAIGDTHSAMSILGNIVCMCQSKALFTDALKYVTQSVELSSRSGSEKDLAGNFLTLGTLYLTLGLEDVAGRYLNEAASIFQKLKDSHMEGWVQLSLAYLYKNLGRYDEGLAYLDIVIKKGNDSGYDDLVLWGNYEAADLLLDLGDAAKAENYLGNVQNEWPSVDAADETAVKVELLRCKQKVVDGSDLGDDLEKRFSELAELSEKMELKDLEGEIYHNFSAFYHKAGDEIKSAQCVAKAKSIIEDIASSLSEEYRASYMKQQFRQKVFEDSIRLKDIISDLEEGESKAAEADEAAADELEGGGGPAGEQAGSPGAAQVPDLTGGEGVTGETSMLTGETSQLSPGEGTPAEKAPATIEIIGQSDAITKIRGMIDQLKDSHAPVLISGVPGSEKYAIARTIHVSGIFKDRPWKEVDMSAYSEDYLERILWGEAEKSVFEVAGEGTLYFSNVEKAPDVVQKKMAKAMDKGSFKCPDDGREIHIASRIIISTNLMSVQFTKEVNKNLVSEFSEVVIELPPLSSRKTDIPLLIEHFLKKISGEHKLGEYSIEPKALALMMKHKWPGDVAELEATLTSICTVFKDGKITDEQVQSFLG